MHNFVFGLGLGSCRSSAGNGEGRQGWQGDVACGEVGACEKSKDDLSSALAKAPLEIQKSAYWENLADGLFTALSERDAVGQTELEHSVHRKKCHEFGFRFSKEVFSSSSAYIWAFSSMKENIKSIVIHST